MAVRTTAICRHDHVIRAIGSESNQHLEEGGGGDGACGGDEDHAKVILLLNRELH